MGKDLQAMIIAGGTGSRLRPLTLPRAKPSVPFAGRYRIIDFALSNMVNSNIENINVLIQSENNSLNKHIQDTYKNVGGVYHQSIYSVPPKFSGDNWRFKGTADAIYQNLNLVFDYNPSDVAIFGADHIYKMDISQMLEFHNDTQAALTIAAIPVPIDEARGNFGVIQVDKDYRIISFVEKPQNPEPIPGNPNMCLVSMGNYIFTTDELINILCVDHDREKKYFIHSADDPYKGDTEEYLKLIARNPSNVEKYTIHDMGHNIVRQMIRDGKQVFAYDFMLNEPGKKPQEHEKGYWRDVGSIEQYFAANMDQVEPLPKLNLFGSDNWPIIYRISRFPSSKIVHGNSHVIDALLSDGAIVSGARVEKSILSQEVYCHRYSSIYKSILFKGVKIGRHTELNRVIADINVEIEESSQFNPLRIGFDPILDKERGFYVINKGDISENITVIPKGMHIDGKGNISFPVPKGLKDNPDFDIRLKYEEFLEEMKKKKH